MFLKYVRKYGSRIDLQLPFLFIDPHDSFNSKTVPFVMINHAYLGEIIQSVAWQSSINNTS
jgi:hypothetical protein